MTFIAQVPLAPISTLPVPPILDGTEVLAGEKKRKKDDTKTGNVARQSTRFSIFPNHKQAFGKGGI